MILVVLVVLVVLVILVVIVVLVVLVALVALVVLVVLVVIVVLFPDLFRNMFLLMFFLPSPSFHCVRLLVLLRLLHVAPAIHGDLKMVGTYNDERIPLLLFGHFYYTKTVKMYCLPAAQFRNKCRNILLVDFLKMRHICLHSRDAGHLIEMGDYPAAFDTNGVPFH